MAWVCNGVYPERNCESQGDTFQMFRDVGFDSVTKRILIKGHVEYEAGYNPAAALISKRSETFNAHWGFDGKQ
jgi:hypothetical protein